MRFQAIQYHQMRSLMPFSIIRAIAVREGTHIGGRSTPVASLPSCGIADIGKVTNLSVFSLRNRNIALSRAWFMRLRRSVV